MKKKCAVRHKKEASAAESQVVERVSLIAAESRGRAAAVKGLDRAAALGDETMADRRDQAVDLREKVLSVPELEAGLRSKAAQTREEESDHRDLDARAMAKLSARRDTLLQETIERLVVATVSAETMAEVARHDAAQMSYRAENDFLTGLPNRSLLTDRVVQAISLALRHDKRVALMYLDLDHFKQVNDSLGHEIGDQLLQLVAKRMQACIRASDTVSRQGGDEFVVLLAEIDEQHDAELAARKLIQAVSVPFVIGNHRLAITCSVGISVYPDDGSDVDAMLRNADTAMYHAKKRGRNRYLAFKPEMNAVSVAQNTIKAAVQRGLEQHQLLLHYQPKVNLETGAITGAEVLVRVRCENLSLLYPKQFITIAEDCGLIVQIGKSVLREACSQAAAWIKAGLHIDQIAVNVSAVEFHSKEFVSGVCKILNDTGLDPHYLELELTDTAFMQESEQSSRILDALKKCGIMIAIDHFGAGCFSLSYLRRLPIDTLKIDQSFVHGLNPDTGKEIISAIIAIGKNFGRRVVADGIETKEQLEFLRSQKCLEGQGYFFKPPMGAQEFGELLCAGER